MINLLLLEENIFASIRPKIQFGTVCIRDLDNKLDFTMVLGLSQFQVLTTLPPKIVARVKSGQN